MIGSGRLVDILWIPEYSRSFDTVPISRAYLPKPGTYSTEPGLTVLTVSSGTLTPAFHSQTLNYTVPDVANADGRITLTTTTKADYYNVAFIPGSFYFYIAACSHGGQQTSLSYGDGTGNPLYPLTDADANTPGFQMELDEGENVFKIHVWPNCASGHGYKLTVTRAANAPANTPATGAPTISGAAQVGETLTAATSGIADADGLSGATFSYQWLSSRDTEIQGATDVAYILVPGDAGKTIKVKVSFTDDEGNAEMLTSAATDAVSPAPTPNNPATGAPTISGTAQVGETLAAETSGINDDDGLDNVAYTYQWLSSRDTEIQGATDRTYTLAATDEGKAIKVRVSFTDDANNQETLTSAATAAVAAAPTPNSPATGAPTISGTAQVGETLTANTSEVADSDGLSSVQYEYQWLADDAEISGATGSTYTVAAADEGKAIKVEVSFTDDAGNNEGALISAATEAVAAAPTPNNPATGVPAISGTVQVGETLTANTSGVADADGLSNVQYEYQWLADDAEIAGATGLTYTLTDSEESKAITARVSFTDDAGNEETLTSAATGAVDARPNSPATGAPTIRGTAQVGETLTADITGIADADGMENDEVSFQWSAYDNATGLYLLQMIELEGTYTIEPRDVGMAISVIAIFTDDRGNTESLESAPTEPVAAAANTPAAGAPVIIGTAQVGETLTADTSGIQDANGLSGATFSYQWLGSRDTEIQGATNATYTLVAADEGKAIKVRVSFTDDRGNAESLTSAPTSAVEANANNPATGLPTISGTAQVGETLTAGITGIADADGLSGESFTYQWVSGDGTTDTDIENATGATYKLVDADQGKAIKVRVTFTDGGGNEETLTSAPTGPVLGDGLPGAPRNLTATPGNKEITLSWDPPDDNGNAPATRYRIEWRIDGKDYKKGHWGPSGKTTYTKTDLANGVKYIFRVKAENGNGNSYGPYGPASEEVSATPTSGLAVDLGTPVLSNTKTLHHGMVKLDWEDIEGAGWYVVQYYHVKSGEWLDLPTAGVDIAFHGSSAVVSNLHGLSWLRVRAMSCAGESEWSQIEELYGTKASDWEDVPVPEVAEGDQIDPCPVILGTPVLSGPETLHHGMVRLDWQDIEDAGRYVVQYYHVKGGEWLDLPAEGVDIAFHGSSAVVSNLHGLSWLRVRAMSCAGASEWSQIEELYGTNASDWEGVPVPEVEEGDEIEPCPEDADTPDNSPATGAPTIIGTAQVGEALTVDTSGIADADGLTSVTYSYQWLADDAEIAGATSLTYTLADTDEGKAIKVKVSFTDDVDNEETLTSAATPVVAAVPVHAKSAPDLEVGTPWVAHRPPLPAGSRFTLSIRVTNAGDGASEATRLRYYRSTDSTITSSDTEQGSESVGALAAAGRSDHAGGMTAPSEAGTYYYGACVDSVTNESDTTDNCSSAHLLIMSEPAPDLVVIGIDATDNIVTGGSFRVGVTVTNQGDAQSAATTLRWKKEVDGTTTEIGTSAQRALTRPQGSFKTIRLTAPSTPGTSYYWACVDSVAGESDTTNNCSGSVTVTVTNNLATGAPTISGTSQVGQTLTADTSGIADADGLANATFSYQWLADDTDIAGATGLTYTLTDSEESKAITVQVSFTDDAGNQETLTSAATAAVAGAQPTEPPAKPRNLSATATHDSVTLTWDDPGDNTITGYVILRRIPGVDPQGHFNELVADTGSAATTYTDNTVSAETRYTYRIKAINGAGTSERSRWFHIDTPAAPVPNKPTGLEATESDGQVVLTWDDPADDTITGYVILRRVRENNTGGDFSVLVADTGSAATTYTDDTVAAETRYTYRIKAINEHGTSERSRWFHIDIPAAP